MPERCGAPRTSSSGGRCGQPAGWGTEHVGSGRCRYHESGGSVSPSGGHRAVAADRGPSHPDPPQEVPPRRRGRRRPTLVWSLIALVVFAAAVWFLAESQDDTGEPIVADSILPSVPRPSATPEVDGSPSSPLAPSASSGAVLPSVAASPSLDSSGGGGPVVEPAPTASLASPAPDFSGLPGIGSTLEEWEETREPAPGSGEVARYLPIVWGSQPAYDYVQGDVSIYLYERHFPLGITLQTQEQILRAEELPPDSVEIERMMDGSCEIVLFESKMLSTKRGEQTQVLVSLDDEQPSYATLMTTSDATLEDYFC